MNGVIVRSIAEKGRLFAFSLAFFLGVMPTSQVFAKSSDEPDAKTHKNIEYKFTIQVNVVRICADGRYFDLLEADTAGAGAWIKPYVVEVVDKTGQTVTCETEPPKQATSAER